VILFLVLSAHPPGAVEIGLLAHHTLYGTEAAVYAGSPHTKLELVDAVTTSTGVITAT
jgi:hypothetical protein